MEASKKQERKNQRPRKWNRASVWHFLFWIVAVAVCRLSVCVCFASESNCSVRFLMPLDGYHAWKCTRTNTQARWNWISVNAIQHQCDIAAGEHKHFPTHTCTARRVHTLFSKFRRQPKCIYDGMNLCFFSFRSFVSSVQFGHRFPREKEVRRSSDPNQSNQMFSFIRRLRACVFVKCVL